MSKGMLVNLLLLVGALVLGLLVAEAAVRIVAPQETMYPRWIDSVEYPLALAADATIIHSQGRLWHFEYTTNRLGRRGPYVSPAGSDSVVTVVALGDSFTFGSGVSDDEVYSQVLSRMLGPPYVVVNGGMGGFGLDSEIKWFFREGLPHEPEFVTLQFAANDPTDFFGVTRLDDAEFTFHPNPNIRPRWQLLLSESAVIQKSHLYAALRNILGRPTLRGNATRSPEASERNQDRYVQLLRRFASELERQEIELLFFSVTHSEPGDVYHYDIDHFPIIRKEVERLDSLGLSRFVELPRQQMSAFPGSPEGHQWSGPHHELVARSLAEAIRGPLDGG